MDRESVARTATAAKTAGVKSARRIKAALQTVTHDGLDRLKETTAQLKQTTAGLVESVKERIVARQEGRDVDEEGARNDAGRATGVRLDDRVSRPRDANAGADRDDRSTTAGTGTARLEPNERGSAPPP